MMGICQSRSDAGASSGLSGKTTLGSLLLKKMESSSLELGITQTYIDGNTSLYRHMKISQVYQNQWRKLYPPTKELHVSVEGVRELLRKVKSRQVAFTQFLN